MPSLISNEKIEQVRLASDIVDVVSGYLTLRKQGKNYFGLCPFHHEKTPSFSVNPDMQIFHCFGCGSGGNVFTFVMRIEGLTFPESVKILAKTAGIVLPEEDENIEHLQEKETLFYANKLASEFYTEYLLNSSEAETGRSYLEKRGLTADIFTKYGIGFAPDSWDSLILHARSHSINPEVLFKAGLVVKKDEGRYYDRFRGRVTFAIKNTSGQNVAFGARKIVNDDSPKYINSPETDIYQKRYILYGLYDCRDSIRREDTVVIVEGYTDIISLNRIGINNVVATSGTALTEDHCRLVRRYTNKAILLYDSDSAGAAAALRGADLLLENGLEVSIATLPNGQDPDEFARTNDVNTVKTLLSEANSLIQFKLNALEQKGLLKTPSQRTEATKSMLHSVASIKDHIQRSFIIKDLAEKLHVEEPVLWSEVKKQERHSPIRVKKNDEKIQKAQTVNKFFETRRGVAEFGLLEIALLSPEYGPKIFLNLRYSDFKHPEIQRLFQQFEIELINNASIDPARFVSIIKEPFIVGKLSQIISAKKKRDYSWQFVRDCIIKLQLAIFDDEIEIVRNSLLEKNSDASTAQQLMEKYKGLVDQRHKIVHGEFITE